MVVSVQQTEVRAGRQSVCQFVSQSVSQLVSQLVRPRLCLGRVDLAAMLRAKPKLLAASVAAAAAAAVARVVHFVYSRKARARASHLRALCMTMAMAMAGWLHPLPPPASPATASACCKLNDPVAHVCKNVYTNHKIQATRQALLT